LAISFGGSSPQRGGGRILLLGEVIGADGARYDLQLQGIGTHAILPWRGCIGCEIWQEASKDQHPRRSPTP